MNQLYINNNKTEIKNKGAGKIFHEKSLQIVVLKEL